MNTSDAQRVCEWRSDPKKASVAQRCNTLTRSDNVMDMEHEGTLHGTLTTFSHTISLDLGSHQHNKWRLETCHNEWNEEMLSTCAPVK